MDTVTVKHKIIHRAASRGYADHGWLKTRYSFSFADFYDAHRMHFGALDVLNDHWMASGEGFGTVPNADTELITIPLDGALRHCDGLGNDEELVPGRIQVMTAGTGMLHRECNASELYPVAFLQLWIRPDGKGHVPRYEAVDLAHARRNALRLIVAPEGCGSQHVGWIHQTAWLYTLALDAGRVVEYRLNVHGNGVYLFVLEGSAAVAGEELGPRDGMGMWCVDEMLVKGLSAVQLLIVEVPMT